MQVSSGRGGVRATFLFHPAWFLRVLALLFTVSVFTNWACAEESVDKSSRLKVPAGFLIERVAGPPLVDRPICADFDELGRLYVAEASGTNDPVPKQLDQKPHHILQLTDTDGDGRFDRKTIYADQLMLPEGTMWLEGSLYVAAPPSICNCSHTRKRVCCS